MRAEGVRIGWTALPAEVRAWVESVLGGPVVSAVSQPGGFSPGSADRVVTAGGRRAFVKAVSPEQNPVAVELHRRELAVSRQLPPSVPAPALLDGFDDGDWIALIFEDVEGRHPEIPWRADELDLVRAALAGLAAVPAPWVPPAGEALADVFGGWRRLASSPEPSSPEPPYPVTFGASLPDRIELADHALTAAAGEVLVHLDVRADNLLVMPTGEIFVVDWPHACRGVPWLDTVLLLINVRLYGGHDTNALLRRVVSDFGVEPLDVVATLAAALGYFLEGARQPPPPGLPTLRAFQAAQGRALGEWLAELPPDLAQYL